jgi:hypothetical protein
VRRVPVLLHVPERLLLAAGPEQRQQLGTKLRRRGIDASHNREAGGNRLRLFYEYDHLLDKDPFYVEIINGPPV